MIPVLEFMERSAGRLGLNSDLTFYWATGMLSALLDNAPTYLALLAAALGLHGLDINESSHVARFVGENGRELIAISLGATFFGALTYIGNAPNLLVKTIAEHARVPNAKLHRIYLEVRAADSSPSLRRNLDTIFPLRFFSSQDTRSLVLRSEAL